MKGKWNNLQKTLPDSNQIGKLVELKIANTKTSNINVIVCIKLVDCLEKCLICRHIRRFAD